MTYRNRDIERYVPNFLNIFHQYAKQFTQPEIERALWNPVSKHNAKSTSDNYFGGVALLHLFIASQTFEEALLWESRDLMVALDEEQRVDKWTFSDLVAAAITHVNSTDFLNAPSREAVLSLLRLVLHYDQATPEHIESYLNIAGIKAKPYIDRLAAKVLSIGRISTLHAIINYYTRVHSLSNTFLDRLWTITNHQNQNDLAWRIATVMSARQALEASITKAWEISGEKRNTYSPNQFGATEFEIALFGLSDNGKRLVRALATLGNQLIQLSLIIRRDDVHSKTIIQPFTALEKTIIELIGKTGHLANAIRHTASGVNFAHTGGPFINLLFHIDKNPWVFSACVVIEKMSLASWDCSIEALRQLTESVHPMVGGRLNSSSSHKIGRWLSHLNSPQRTAWSDLQAVVKEIDQVELTHILAVFVAQVAILVYPSHYQAIVAMQKSGFSLQTIRCIENFILSNEYSNYRLKRGIHSRVAVPKTFGVRSILQAKIDLASDEEI